MVERQAYCSLDAPYLVVVVKVAVKVKCCVRLRLRLRLVGVVLVVKMLSRAISGCR
jgi:hypothetical protein